MPRPKQTDFVFDLSSRMRTASQAHALFLRLIFETGLDNVLSTGATVDWADVGTE